MPTYDYACEACGHAFERFERMTASAPACPRCGRPARRKIGAGSGVIFKGTGFYATDYKEKP